MFIITNKLFNSFPKNLDHSSLDFIFKFKEKEKELSVDFFFTYLFFFVQNRFANFLNDFIWCPSRAAYHCKMHIEHFEDKKKAQRQNHK